MASLGSSQTGLFPEPQREGGQASSLLSSGGRAASLNMHGNHLVTLPNAVCTEGELPTPCSTQTFQFPQLQRGCVLPPTRHPFLRPASPHPMPSQCPLRRAKQVEGHIDPLLESSWSRTNLKSSQPRAGAWWLLGPRDGGARAELRGRAGLHCGG